MWSSTLLAISNFYEIIEVFITIWTSSEDWICKSRDKWELVQWMYKIQSTLHMHFFLLSRQLVLMFFLFFFAAVWFDVFVILLLPFGLTRFRFIAAVCSDDVTIYYFFVCFDKVAMYCFFLLQRSSDFVSNFKKRRTISRGISKTKSWRKMTQRKNSMRTNNRHV